MWRPPILFAVAIYCQLSGWEKKTETIIVIHSKKFVVELAESTTFLTLNAFGLPEKKHRRTVITFLTFPCKQSESCNYLKQKLFFVPRLRTCLKCLVLFCLSAKQIQSLIDWNQIIIDRDWVLLLFFAYAAVLAVHFATSLQSSPKNNIWWHWH